MSMMSPPPAADDVSPLTLRNDVARCTRNDAMFAPMCPQARIIAEGNIMCEARIIGPAGQTSFKKMETEGFACIPFSLAGDGKTEYRNSPVCALAHAHAPGVCGHDSNPSLP